MRAMATIVAALGLTLAASAASADRVNKSLFGTAVEGYDMVAYFTEKRAVEGKKEHFFEWRGATWRFASAENRRRFAADPEAYAPQYGGFCAYAVSHGTTAPVDPQAWKIVEGKLYLNLDEDVQALWERDIPGHIARADANWPELAKE